MQRHEELLALREDDEVVGVVDPRIRLESDRIRHLTQTKYVRQIIFENAFFARPDRNTMKQIVVLQIPREPLNPKTKIQLSNMSYFLKQFSTQEIYDTS